jgi:Fe-S-cluster containining protein
VISADAASAATVATMSGGADNNRRIRFMRRSLWNDCLTCENPCCMMEWLFPLFLTPKEKKQLPEAGKKISCAHCIFLNEKGLCDVYKKRPFDCRFFPFDVHEMDGKFFWIVWKIPCPIVKKRNYEPYLREHEEKLVPKFKKFLTSYSAFRSKELLNAYEYKVLREINMRSDSA